MEIPKRLTSRKFWLTVSAVVAAITAMVSGEMETGEAVWAIVTAVGAYVGVEGLGDAAERMKAKEAPDVIVTTHTPTE
jgi:hypothetical protein